MERRFLCERLRGRGTYEWGYSVTGALRKQPVPLCDYDHGDDHGRDAGGRGAAPGCRACAASLGDGDTKWSGLVRCRPSVSAPPHGWNILCAYLGGTLRASIALNGLLLSPRFGRLSHSHLMVNLERKKCWDFESRELSYTQLLYEIKNERGAWIKFKTSYNFDMYTDDESFFTLSVQFLVQSTILSCHPFFNIQ